MKHQIEEIDKEIQKLKEELKEDEKRLLSLIHRKDEKKIRRYIV